MANRIAATVALLALASCSRPIARARTSVMEPASPAETEAAARIAKRSCSPLWSLLVPGAGEMCTGATAEGATLAGLAVAEAGTAIVAATQVEVPPEESTLDHPAVLLPVLALQDLYVYSIASQLVLKDRAIQRLYAPADSTLDLAAAPFNLEVMKDPRVWGGILGAVTAGVAISFALDDELDTGKLGDDPNLFGRTFDATTGYPIGLGIFGGVFTHVAMAEETLFRGFLQSALARRYGENGGLIAGSLIFGLAHAPNALALEGDERREYLLYAVPAITVLGSYLSWLYKDAGYSLAPSTAMHFWYDFLLSAVVFATAPDISPLSATLRFEL